MSSGIYKFAFQNIQTWRACSVQCCLWRQSQMRECDALEERGVRARLQRHPEACSIQCGLRPSAFSFPGGEEEAVHVVWRGQSLIHGRGRWERPLKSKTPKHRLSPCPGLRVAMAMISGHSARHWGPNCGCSNSSPGAITSLCNGVYVHVCAHVYEQEGEQKDIYWEPIDARHFPYTSSSNPQSNLQGRCCRGHLRVKKTGAPRSKVVCTHSLVSKGWSQFEGEAPPSSRAVTTPQCGLGSLEEANSPNNPPEFYVQWALVLHMCSEHTFSIMKECVLEWNECYSGFKSEDVYKST